MHKVERELARRRQLHDKLGQAQARPVRHGIVDDVQALFTGSLLAALGILLFNSAGLMSGGTVGLALLVNYAAGLPLSLALVLVNAPFYLFAALRMGRAFTLKTLAAVALMAMFVQLVPQGLSFSAMGPYTASAVGGLLAGVGMLVIFRHRGSLGGLNVLALYVQERIGWSAGVVQLFLDGAILAGGLLFLQRDWQGIGASVLAVVVLNLVLALNHRPGRYLLQS